MMKIFKEKFRKIDLPVRFHVFLTFTDNYTNSTN